MVRTPTQPPKRPPNKYKARGGSPAHNRERSLQLENIIDSLHAYDFVVFDSYRDFTKTLDDNGDVVVEGKIRQRYVVKNFPHPSLYGTIGRKEAYIFDHGTEYILEAKLQTTSGSVDEKLPYLHRAFLTSHIPNWIVVLDGHFWRDTLRAQKAIDWLREQAKSLVPAWRRQDGGRLYITASRTEWRDLSGKLFRKAIA